MAGAGQHGVDDGQGVGTGLTAKEVAEGEETEAGAGLREEVAARGVGGMGVGEEAWGHDVRLFFLVTFLSSGTGWERSRGTWDLSPSDELGGDYARVADLWLFSIHGRAWRCARRSIPDPVLCPDIRQDLEILIRREEGGVQMACDCGQHHVHLRYGPADVS